MLDKTARLSLTIMNPITVFLARHIILVYFVYGLSFFSMGIALALAVQRTLRFPIERAIPALAGFGLLHGLHEWFEMFQKMAALVGDRPVPIAESLIRLGILVVSFLFLLRFGLKLIWTAQGRKRSWIPQAWMIGFWMMACLLAIIVLRPKMDEAIVFADVLSRYLLGVPGALLASWALLVQQRYFREHDLPQFGRDLVWCAAALFLYGAVGQTFIQSTRLFPLNSSSSATFLEWFGIPIQLFRAIMAGTLSIFMVRALNAFGVERERQMRAADQERLLAQADMLVAERRANRDTERLNEELRLATQELSLLLGLSNILATSTSLQAKLERALEEMVRTLHFPDTGAIILIDPQSQDLQARATVGFKAADGPNEFESAYQEALDIAEICVAWKIAMCKHVDGLIVNFQPQSPEEREKCQNQGSPVYLIGLPLTVGQQVIGSVVLGLLSRVDDTSLTLEEFQLMLGAAQQLGLSIENAQLTQQAQEREKRLGDLLRQVVHAQEAERQRIALELHDATGQSLTAVSLGLRGIESILVKEPEKALIQVREIQSYSTAALGELRQIISDLRPSQLDDLGLIAALQWTVREFEKRYHLPITFTADGEKNRLPSEYETVLFRITQEALTNIAKHSRATGAGVRLLITETEVSIEIEDNGRGFDPETILRRDKPDGWGLLGMQERAHLLGGDCRFESTPGQGTLIRVAVPTPSEVDNVKDQVTSR